jgi:hypothetical protein
MNIRQDAAEKAFHLMDGSTIRNVEELRDKLLQISEHEYSHHVNEFKNDFFNWVRDVYGDKRLANRLAKAKTALQAADAITKRLAETSPKVDTKVVKSLKHRHQIKKRVKYSTAARKITIPAKKAVTIKIKNKKSSKKKKQLKIITKSINKEQKKQKSVIMLAKKTLRRASVPNAQKFLAAYMAMQRPTTTHLYLTRGIADFLLGFVIGVLVGIVIANIL